MPEGCLMKSIMTALAPLKSRHPRLGQSLWWLCVCVCQVPIAPPRRCFHRLQCSSVALLSFHRPRINQCRSGVCTLVWLWVRQFTRDDTTQQYTTLH